MANVDLKDCVLIVTAMMCAIEALVVVLDAEGRIVFFNHRCQKKAGIDITEFRTGGSHS